MRSLLHLNETTGRYLKVWDKTSPTNNKTKDTPHLAINSAQVFYTLLVTLQFSFTVSAFHGAFLTYLYRLCPAQTSHKYNRL